MSDWQPISTAPRDGTTVLIYANGRYKICSAKFVESFKEWQSQPGGWPCRPTHWMPLPEAPQ